MYDGSALTKNKKERKYVCRMPTRLSAGRGAAEYRSGKAVPFGPQAVPVLFDDAAGLVTIFILFYLPLPGLIIAFKDYTGRLGIWGVPG